MTCILPNTHQYSNVIELDGIFDWYETHKTTMILSDNTRNKVETILEALKNRLTQM